MDDNKYNGYIPLEEVISTLSPDKDNMTLDDVENIKEYGNYIEEIISEENEVFKIIEHNDNLLSSIAKAEAEIVKHGVISIESANDIAERYNLLVTILGDDEQVSLESALTFKNEIFYLTKENANNKSWLTRLIEKFVSFCKAIYYKVVEYSTKLGVAVTRQEITASELASYITDNLDNFKVDKWEYMIPIGDILGNFTILKSFDRKSIEDYIKFNNGGFQSDKLVSLFMQCVDRNNMEKFRKLEGIPIDYDVSNYFKNYKDAKTVPIDISGATGHCLLSYNLDGNIKIERKKFSIVADASFRSSLKTKGILSREDMVSVLRQINISVRANRENISRLYEYIKNIHKVINNINEGVDRKFVSDAIHCGTVLVNALSISSRVGLFSNSFIIGVIGRMAKVYKKQHKIRQ